MAPNHELVRIGEAARMLGVHPTTLNRWALAGRIRYFEIGPYKERRFAKEDILALFRERRTTPGPGEET